MSWCIFKITNANQNVNKGQKYFIELEELIKKIDNEAKKWAEF